MPILTGIDAPRMKSVLGGYLTSARIISNTMHKSDCCPTFSDHLAVAVMQFGQFIEHDVISTPMVTGISCLISKQCAIVYTMWWFLAELLNMVLMSYHLFKKAKAEDPNLKKREKTIIHNIKKSKHGCKNEN